MIDQGTLLIVDDDEMFRESISHLLRREGFDCHEAGDAQEALAKLEQMHFDTLIADIRMPDNPNLRLVREARRLDPQMPVILVTGYPSMDTAIHSVELSVVAYLTKPVELEELLRHVKPAVAHSRTRHTLQAVCRRLQSCLMDLEALLSKPLPRAGEPGEPPSVGTIRTLAACLSDLLVIQARQPGGPGAGSLCELLDCPQQPLHRQAILESIEVLKKTKEIFKSKALGELRTKLESLFKATPPSSPQKGIL